MSSNDGFELIIAPLADKEYHASVDWYEEKIPNLGLDFFNEVKSVLEIIKQNPYTFQIKKLQNREAPLKTFPYLIIYKIHPKKKEVMILSIFHTSRNPSEKNKR